jgi:hypothetical protein
MSGGAPALPSPPDGTDGAKPETVPAVPLYQGGAGGHEIRSLEDIKKYGSYQDIEDSEQGVPSKYSGTVGTVSHRDAFLKRLGELRQFDEEGARTIVGDAVKSGLSGLIVETLIKPLSVALGVKENTAKKLWEDEASKVRPATEATKANEEPTAEDRARLEREDRKKRKREAQAEQARLWASCKEVATSLALLADMEAVVHRLGVVGEGAAIKGAYLTASSRLNRARAICLLRRGAASGGKNFLISKTLTLIPSASVIHMSSGSPLSLVYYGRGDEDALKGKVLYLAEAAILAEKKGAESPLTVLVRTLISEGRIDHNVAVPQADGSPVTMSIRRNGPVVVMITSARDNVEEEMLTRLMMSDADESATHTLAVLTDVLSKEAREVDEAEIKKWLSFQMWLELGAPYDVVIPYRGAILAAFNERLADMQARGKRPNIQLRIRRDVHGFLTAIMTSAILHKAQRQTDSAGRIVATIDDYRHAHEAFDGGLGRLYKIKTPATALAVVRAIEAMGATRDKGVKVSVTDLMDKLVITGRGTASDRLRDADERGFLKVVEAAAEYGRTSARVYKIGRSSEESCG